MQIEYENVDQFIYRLHIPVGFSCSFMCARARVRSCSICAICALVGAVVFLPSQTRCYNLNPP